MKWNETSCVWNDEDSLRIPTNGSAVCWRAPLSPAPIPHTLYPNNNESIRDGWNEFLLRKSWIIDQSISGSTKAGNDAITPARVSAKSSKTCQPAEGKALCLTPPDLDSFLSLRHPTGCFPELTGEEGENRLLRWSSMRGFNEND